MWVDFVEGAGVAWMSITLKILQEVLRMLGYREEMIES